MLVIIYYSYILYFIKNFVHILPNVNVFSRRQFLLLMLGLNMYNIIKI